MEEALDILWTYARREPIESNGKTIVATISQSIAAIRLLIRLEGWLQRSEKVNSEKKAAPAYATPTLTTCDLPAVECLTSDLPTPICKGKVSESGAGEQFAQANIDTQARSCLAASSPMKKKLRTSRQEPNLPTAKASYHVTKPRKVCHQRRCVKDDKSPNHTNKPRKVCRQRSVTKEDLYKEITLIGSPMMGVPLNRIATLTVAKALPP